MAAQLSTADIKKQLAAQQARAAGQPPTFNTNVAPPAGTTASTVAGQPNSASAVDPFQQAAARQSLNAGTNPGYGGPSAADIAALTGLDIHQVLAMQADPTQALQLQALYNAAQSKQQNQNYVTNNFTPAAATAGTNENTALQGMQGVATNQQNLAGGLLAGYGAAYGQQQGFANTANAADASALAGYGQNLGVASGMQAGAYNQLAGAYGGMSQLSSTPFTANVQAQQAATNLANYQTSALNTATAYNAALTKAGMQNASYQGYTPDGYSAQQAQYDLANTHTLDEIAKAHAAQSALSTAYSDEGDVAAERAALGQLTGMAGGSLDTVNGAGSGGGLAAQQDALAQYSALTSPQATAKEKFLYEQQREAQEQQEAASRAALMNDYRVRGVGGSGMELASILQAGQQNSQQRLLGDLGTQAGAVDRSMQALAGYGGLASQMTAQGNQVNQANMANRLGAAGAQGQLAGTIRGQGDTLAMYNSGQANQNSQFNVGQQNQVGMFNANQTNNVGMFNTGQQNTVGIANMQAYNQANQFNANAVNQSNAFNANANNDAGAFNANAYNANSMFNANAYNTNQYQNAMMANDNSQFNANANNTNSMFNAGQANQNNQFNANAYNSNSQFNANASNQVGMFNAGQTNTVNMSNSQQNMIQSQFADQFRADQQTDAANRALNLANTGVTVAQNFAGNAGNAFTAQQNTAANQYDRNTTTNSLGLAGLTNGYNALTTANQLQNGVYQTAGQNAANQFGRTLAVGGAFMNAGNAGTTAINTQLNTSSGDEAAKQAAAAAANAPQSGPLGLWTIPTQSGQRGQILGVGFKT